MMIRFSEPLLPEENLCRRCPHEEMGLEDRAEQVVAYLVSKCLHFQATKPDEGFAFNVDSWSSLLGCFSEVADEMNSQRLPCVEIGRPRLFAHLPRLFALSGLWWQCVGADNSSWGMHSIQERRLFP
ncbi:MAG: hypothetical protein GY696_35660 [Gammaproteobacteria bacterium]|nr:hypothetical protein [Gammaproteobacteria bacterium]